jgi:hypothetical protein
LLDIPKKDRCVPVDLEIVTQDRIHMDGEVGIEIGYPEGRISGDNSFQLIYSVLLMILCKHLGSG